MGSLDGKRVIVTGGAGSIGNAAVHALEREGALIACTYLSTEPNLPRNVEAARCDITIREEVDTTFDKFARMLGGLDVLIHAAGIHGSCPAEQLTDATWEATFALNGKATMLTNQAAFRHLRARGGAIVNIGSVEGIRGHAGNSCYAATRGAVMSWTRSIALEWGRYNVRANCVAPVVTGGASDRIQAKQDQAAYTASEAELAKSVPLGGRIGHPLHDLGPVLAFLVSDASHFMTGQTICVDGGLLMLGS